MLCIELFPRIQTVGIFRGLSVLLNEPIPGQGVFWSSVGNQPYPIPLRVLSFEHMYTVLDPQNTRAAVDAFAQTLKTKFQSALQDRLEQLEDLMPLSTEGNGSNQGEEAIDALALYRKQAIRAFQNNSDILRQIRERGIPWGAIFGFLVKQLPEEIDESGREDIARHLVDEAVGTVFGRENEGWHKEDVFSSNKNRWIKWVKMGEKSS